MRKEECYLLGKILRKHGFSGNLLLKLDTDQPEFYNKLESIYVELNGLLVPFFVENQKWSRGDALILTLKNVTEAISEQMVGKQVYLPLSTLPPLHGKQFYYHEVIGFKIKDQNDHPHGIIESINDSAAQAYFILGHENNEVVIPIIKDWILEVNREQRFIKMDLPNGLLNIYVNK